MSRPNRQRAVGGWLAVVVLAWLMPAAGLGQAKTSQAKEQDQPQKAPTSQPATQPATKPSTQPATRSRRSSLYFLYSLGFSQSLCRLISFSIS